MEKHQLTTDLSNGIVQALERYPEAIVALSLIDPAKAFKFHLNETRAFHAASLMKVPVMLDIYHQVSNGRLSLSDEIVVRNHFSSIVDNSSYCIEEDTDDYTYSQIGQRITIQELIVRMITVSSNIATNILIDIVDISSISATLENLGAINTRVLRGVEDIKAFDQGINNTITSKDMSLVLQWLLEGKNIQRDHAHEMIDILLQQNTKRDDSSRTSNAHPDRP